MPLAASPPSEPQAFTASMGADRLTRWKSQCIAVNVEVRDCLSGDVEQELMAALAGHRIRSLLVSPEVHTAYPGLARLLEEMKVALIDPMLPHKLDHAGRKSALSEMARAQAGLTLASAGLAASGSVVLQHPRIHSGLASLLPQTHFAILRADAVYRDYREWIRNSDPALQESRGKTIIVSGPSRTADIEMTLTVGVHGPAKLVVILVG